jgi:ankyrin repeat/BTB/POZ domain-containing protein 2
MVLPPLVEWARVSTAFAEHRNSTHIDHDDVMQGARILLPGMDCPVRPLENPPLSLSTSMSAMMDELEYVNHVKKEMALHMLQTGRRDLVPHALQMLPNAEKVNTTNNAGLTPLQMASLRGDTNVVRLLLDTGATVNGRSASGENKDWTALSYAVLNGHYRTAKLLLDRSGHVDGLGGSHRDDIQTETPLQLAAASGSVRMVELLLACGASPFKSTTEGHGSFSSSNNGGCYSAVAVAATHGHKKVLNLLVSHALTTAPSESVKSSTDQVMSLAEILSEGAIAGSGEKSSAADEIKKNSRMVKSQVKKLQDAMYHASEATNLELTLDLRNLGVPWTMHTWMQSLQTANETGLVSVINELLQDFSSTWPEENSLYFGEVGLPLLFNILKTCKTEGTVLLLADIICACYGRIAIEPIDPPKLGELGQPRIDPKFINNPELSDVSFR